MEKPTSKINLYVYHKGMCCTYITIDTATYNKNKLKPSSL